MGITKTDFMRGMQCRKMLWLDKHRPGLRVIPPEIQARLDAGNDFGDRAMGMFGPYEEMTIYRPGTRIPDKKKMAEKTRQHLQAGTAVICEAAFLNYNNYCAADILRKTETGYDFYEVKNAAEVHGQFVKDAGFQYYIMHRCGVRIGRIFIVIHGPEEEHPFVPVDGPGSRNRRVSGRKRFWTGAGCGYCDDPRGGAGRRDRPRRTIRENQRHSKRSL